MADARLLSRAFWVTAPGRGELRTAELAPPGPGKVLVRALVSGISRGTESLVFRGRVPRSQHETMRCPFQEGDFPAPVKYGYALVGHVEAGPAKMIGRRVFCLHPHQDRFVVPLDAVHTVPDDVPDRRAVLAANAETAVNALWDGAPLVGDRIAVVGGGTVGCLVAALAARLPGAVVELVDIDPGRAAIAAQLGAAFALPASARPDCDLVFHASGTGSGLGTALALAGLEAAIVELSWYGAGQVAAPLGEAFHSRRLLLRSSQVGEVAPAKRPRWSRARRLGLALEMLRDPVFDALLTGESDFDALPETMARLAEHAAGTLCHVVRYQ